MSGALENYLKFFHRKNKRKKSKRKLSTLEQIDNNKKQYFTFFIYDSYLGDCRKTDFYS